LKKNVLALTAVAEGVTGLLLLAWPALVVRLLFAEEASGPGIGMSRIAGIALIGFGIACWPGNSAVQQLYGMLTYSTLAMLYLIHIGIRGAPIGPLLWPGVVVHAIIVVLLVWAKWKGARSSAAGT
jgi:hypothetical protein